MPLRAACFRPSISTFRSKSFGAGDLSREPNPIIAGMQAEHFEGLPANRPRKAARGYWGFIKAVGLYSIVKTVAEMWRKVNMGRSLDQNGTPGPK